MNLPEEPLDYLVVAPHPDDAELGMGGTILALLAEGARVGILDLTDGEPTPHGSTEIRARESSGATALLGPTWRGNLGLRNRQVVSDLKARAALAGIFRLLRPRRLFAPYWEDAHPDHLASTSLVEASRFWAKLTKTNLPGQPYYPEKIFYYFAMHLRIHPRPSFVVDISAYQERKMQVLNCYSSQFLMGRPKTFPTFMDDVRDRARYWGWSIGVAYGEPFVTREEIGLRGLRDLL